MLLATKAITGRRNSCILPKISKTLCNQCKPKEKQKNTTRNYDDRQLLSSIERVLKQVDIKAKSEKLSKVKESVQIKRLSNYVLHHSSHRLMPSPPIIQAPLLNEEPRKSPIKIVRSKKEIFLEVNEVSPWEERVPSSRCSLLSCGTKFS